VTRVTTGLVGVCCAMAVGPRGVARAQQGPLAPQGLPPHITGVGVSSDSRKAAGTAALQEIASQISLDLTSTIRHVFSVQSGGGARSSSQEQYFEETRVRVDARLAGLTPERYRTPAETGGNHEVTRSLDRLLAVRVLTEEVRPLEARLNVLVTEARAAIRANDVAHDWSARTLLDRLCVALGRHVPLDRDATGRCSRPPPPGQRSDTPLAR